MVVRSHVGRQVEGNADRSPAPSDMLGDRFSVVELLVVAHGSRAVSNQNLAVTRDLRTRAIHRIGDEVAHTTDTSIVNLDHNEVSPLGPAIAK
jgi:hypothetical protein